MAVPHATVDMTPVNNSEETVPCINAVAPKSNSDAAKGKCPILDKILDPKGPFLQKWNMMLVVSCVLAVLLDPLFLYIPILNDDMKCIGLDSNLKIAAVVLRSLTDLVYIVKITFQVYELQKLTAKKIWESCILLVDILAVLPIPQVLIIVFFTKMRGSGLNTIIMNFLVLIQYVPRVFCIYYACKEFEIASSLKKWESWLNGGLIFFMYILASNAFGAFWYFFSIQRMIDCWQSACHSLNDHNDCKSGAFQCHNQPTIGRTALAYDLCPINPQNVTLFDFGIFLNVLQPGIAGSTNYLQKLTNCLLWALRNLSSFGSNLQPSISLWENLFATSVSIIGLLLFLYLIGKLQIYMGTETSLKVEERCKKEVEAKRKIKLKDKIEPKIILWLDKNDLDHDRFKREVEKDVVDKAVQSKKDDVDESEILRNLSPDLRVAIENLKDEKEIDSWLRKNHLDPDDCLHLKSNIMKAVEEKRKQDAEFDLDPNNILSIVPDGIRTEITDRIYKSMDRLKQVPLLQDVNERGLKRISEKLKLQKYTKSKQGPSKPIIKEEQSLQMIFIIDGVASIEKRYCLTRWELKAGEFYGEELLHRPSARATESVMAKTDVQALILEAEAWQSVVSENTLPISREITVSSKYDINLLSMLKNVPQLEKYDENFLKAISDVLRQKNYDGIGSKIIKENDEQMNKMFLVTRGEVGLTRPGKKNRKLYKEGQLYGEELLDWALDVLHTGTTSSLPLSAGTVSSTKVEVDVLILKAKDLEKKMKDLAATDSESQD